MGPEFKSPPAHMNNRRKESGLAEMSECSNGLVPTSGVRHPYAATLICIGGAVGIMYGIPNPLATIAIGLTGAVVLGTYEVVRKK